MILAAHVFSLIGFSKEDFRASYGYVYRLNDYDTLPLIEEAGTKVIDEVNRSGGWTCIMWQKWGHIADSAAPT